MKKLLGFALAIVSVATIGMVQLDAKAYVDTTRDCDKYAVIYCGTMSVSEARNKYDKGAKIFQAMGISKNEISGTFKKGVVYQNGNVTVGGKVVAKNAKTAIRNMSGGNKIPGTNAAIYSTSRMGSAQAALVKFDQFGRFEFAIMTPCGNPVTATPTQPKPVAKCDSLQVTPLENSRTKFTFKANATVKNGAKIKSYTYVVTKNGKTVLNETTNKASYTYTANDSGKYTVRLKVNTTIGDGITGANCVKSFTVEEETNPSVKIEKFVGPSLEKHYTTDVNAVYDYTLKVTNTGNIQLKDAVVTDTPEEGIELVSAEVGEIKDNVWTTTVTLAPGESKTFILKAKVPEYKDGSIVNTVCVDATEVPGKPDDCDSATVEVPEPTYTLVCDPETGDIITVKEEDAGNYLPKDSEKCKEAPEMCPIEGKEDLPADSEDCKEVPENPKAGPVELPETGPAETAMQLVGAMSIVGASSYYIASRRQ